MNDGSAWTERRAPKSFTKKNETSSKIAHKPESYVTFPIKRGNRVKKRKRVQATLNAFKRFPNAFAFFPIPLFNQEGHISLALKAQPRRVHGS